MEDSLSKEIRLRSQAGDAAIKSIRPNTTGELETSTYVKLPSRASRAVKAVVLPTSSSFGPVGEQSEEISNRNSIRPKAPRTRRIVDPKASNGDAAANRDTNTSATRVQTQKTRKKKNVEKDSSDLADLWNALHKFAVNNSSRSLTGDSAKLGEIHYVNISDKHSANDATTSSSSSASKDLNNALFEKRLNSGQFEIPELPSGTLLAINILSTWGDPYYVGLMGIEIFDDCGRLVTLLNPDTQLWAEPADINVLPEYENDPRTVDNLIDGVNHTCDDLHSWLAPFTFGKNHTVYFKFDDTTTISMVRIWNYNKSRIHSGRGARYIEMSLGNSMDINHNNIIFKGEIRRAIGSHNIVDYEQCCECILFTNKSRILALIEKYDPLQKVLQLQLGTDHTDAGSDDKEILEFRRSVFQYPVADAVPKRDGTSFQSMDIYNIHPLHQIDAGQRPTTGKARVNDGASASVTAKHSDDSGTPTRTFSQQLHDGAANASHHVALTVDHSATLSKAGGSLSRPNHDAFLPSTGSSFLRPSTAALARSQKAIKGRLVEMHLISNWGDSEFVGLTHLCGVDSSLKDFPLPTPSIRYVSANSANLNSSQLFSCENVPNDRYINEDILVNGNALTTDPACMWLAVLPPPSSKFVIALKFDLGASFEFKGLRVFNYNSNGNNSCDLNEETCKGVKNIRVYVDGVLHFNSIVRKAPGADNFDYSQFLPLISIVDKPKAVNLGGSLDLGDFFPRNKGVSNMNSVDATNVRSQSLSNMSSLLSGRQGQQDVQPQLSIDLGLERLRSLTYSPEPLTEVTPRETEEQDIGFGLNDKAFILGQHRRGSDNSTVSRPTGPAFRSNDDSSTDDNTEEGLRGFPTRKKKNNSKKQTTDTQVDEEDIFSQSLGGISVSFIGGGCPVLQQYETPLHPRGCMVKIVILNAHDDGYYVGLNGLQLFDQNGFPISLSPDQLQCAPYRDVNDLPQYRNRILDARVLDNLVNGENDTFNDRDMWLVPLSGRYSASQSGPWNLLYVLLEEPIAISCVKLWNYSKTPSRGAKEIEVYMDDVLVFKGSLSKSPAFEDLAVELKRYRDCESAKKPFKPSSDSNLARWVTSYGLDLSQSILFSNNPDVVEREHSRVPLPEEDLQFFDEGKVMVVNHDILTSTDKRNEACVRPMTSVTGMRKSS